MNYQKIYNSIIERAKDRVPEGYVERHHIIPKCLGGSDDKDNLVALTPEEHFLCHVLLVKIYDEHKGLIYAVQAMCRGHKGHRHRKMYGWLKRKFSAQRKIDAKGLGNTQHGTMWINKIGTTENKKIPTGDAIPEGWVKGRNIKPEKDKYRYIPSVVNFKQEQYDKRKQFAEILFKKFMESNANSLSDFVRSGNYDKSVESLSKLFKKYVSEYKNSKQGNAFKSLTLHSSSG